MPIAKSVGEALRSNGDPDAVRLEHTFIQSKSSADPLFLKRNQWRNLTMKIVTNMKSSYSFLGRNDLTTGVSPKTSNKQDQPFRYKAAVIIETQTRSFDETG
jgi:hypothetical protein